MSASWSWSHTSCRTCACLRLLLLLYHLFVICYFDDLFVCQHPGLGRTPSVAPVHISDISAISPIFPHIVVSRTPPVALVLSTCVCVALVLSTCVCMSSISAYCYFYHHLSIIY